MGTWAWVAIGVVAVAAVIWFVRSTFSFEVFPDSEDDEVAAPRETTTVFSLRRFTIERYDTDADGNEIRREPKEPLYKRYADAGWAGFAFRLVLAAVGLVVAVSSFQDGGAGNVILGAFIVLFVVVPPVVMGLLTLVGWLRDRRSE